MALENASWYQPCQRKSRPGHAQGGEASDGCHMLREGGSELCLCPHDRFLHGPYILSDRPHRIGAVGGDHADDRRADDDAV